MYGFNRVCPDKSDIGDKNGHLGPYGPNGAIRYIGGFRTTLERFIQNGCNRQTGRTGQERQ